MSWTIVVSDPRDGIAYSPSGDYRARYWDIEVFHAGSRILTGSAMVDLNLIEQCTDESRPKREAGEIALMIDAMLAACVERGLKP